MSLCVPSRGAAIGSSLGRQPQEPIAHASFQPRSGDTGSLRDVGAESSRLVSPLRGFVSARFRFQRLTPLATSCRRFAAKDMPKAQNIPSSRGAAKGNSLGRKPQEAIAKTRFQPRSGDTGVTRESA